ncbi:hypothetical protein SS50377_26980 [Spironucleus salmonicida]|uniref:Uncharacterized protein n=1 Tax=Spironucleus salmonicida TaxID=348837 RepID=V6LUW0_9EUKA|nr:hypothetical protein SS50377_26980 [Spironucleus salmonicida]|eukprot:EST47491.1 hypothetical protein SS50377_12477 [Spironucleus salmonicida]
MSTSDQPQSLQELPETPQNMEEQEEVSQNSQQENDNTPNDDMTEQDLNISNQPSKPQTPLPQLSRPISKPPTPLPQITNLSTTQEQRQSQQALQNEIAYGCTFFSGARGSNNPFNVITSQALFQRMKNVNPISYHQASSLLREPFCEDGKSRNFAKTKAQRDIQLQSLCATEIIDILNYRVAQVDSIDIGLEAFKLLGAKDENDVIPIDLLGELINQSYDEFQDQIEMIEDYQQHKQYVKEQIEISEKIKLEQQGGTWNGKKWVDDKVFAPACVNDIMSVISMAVGCEKYMDLGQFRALFEGIKRLQFKDYRRDILKASGKLVVEKKK